MRKLIEEKIKLENQISELEKEKEILEKRNSYLEQKSKKLKEEKTLYRSSFKFAFQDIKEAIESHFETQKKKSFFKILTKDSTPFWNREINDILDFKTLLMQELEILFQEIRELFRKNQEEQLFNEISFSKSKIFSLLEEKNLSFLLDPYKEAIKDYQIVYSDIKEKTNTIINQEYANKKRIQGIISTLRVLYFKKQILELSILKWKASQERKQELETEKNHLIVNYYFEKLARLRNPENSKEEIRTR